MQMCWPEALLRDTPHSVPGSTHGAGEVSCQQISQHAVVCCRLKELLPAQHSSSTADTTGQLEAASQPGSSSSSAAEGQQQAQQQPGLLLLVPLTLGVGRVSVHACVTCIKTSGAWYPHASAAFSAVLHVYSNEDSGCQALVAVYNQPSHQHIARYGCVKLLLVLLQVDERYLPQLAAVLSFPQSVGIVGGRPGASLYFLGAQGSAVLYLDPHEVQEVGAGTHVQSGVLLLLLGDITAGAAWCRPLRACGSRALPGHLLAEACVLLCGPCSIHGLVAALCADQTLMLGIDVCCVPCFWGATLPASR
jgi:hypothetical protein